jgi:hypothetical protein
MRRAISLCQHAYIRTPKTLITWRIMNTQLTEDRRIAEVSSQLADVGLKQPRPPSTRPPSMRPVIARPASTRPTLLERLALRIGIALIIWGRRSKGDSDRSEAIRRYTMRIARETREREYHLEWALSVARR